MTATRDHSDVDHWADATGQDERPAFGSLRGLPWWGSVLLGFVPAAIGVFIDVERTKQLGFIFTGLYFLGCVAAVLWVQRRSVFGAMVQPPLIVAIAVPLVVLVAVGTPKGGLSAKAIAAGTPLINAFPTMAATTAVALIIGIVRIFTQRRAKEPEQPARPRPPAGQANRQQAPRPPAGRRPTPGQGRRPVPPGEAAARSGAPRAGQGGNPPARRPRQQPPQQGRQAGGQPPRRQPPRQPRPFDQQERRPNRQGGRPGGQPRRPEPPRWDDLGHNDDFYTD